MATEEVTSEDRAVRALGEMMLHCRETPGREWFVSFLESEQSMWQIANELRDYTAALERRHKTIQNGWNQHLIHETNALAECRADKAACESTSSSTQKQRTPPQRSRLSSGDRRGVMETSRRELVELEGELKQVCRKFGRLIRKRGIDVAKACHHKEAERVFSEIGKGHHSSSPAPSSSPSSSSSSSSESSSENELEEEEFYSPNQEDDQQGTKHKKQYNIVGGEEDELKGDEEEEEEDDEPDPTGQLMLMLKPTHSRKYHQYHQHHDKSHKVHKHEKSTRRRPDYSGGSSSSPSDDDDTDKDKRSKITIKDDLEEEDD